MFEITITEKKSVTKLVRGEYTVIERRPYMDDELTDAGFYRQSDAGKKGETKPLYGYAPDREQEVEVTREVLKQQVEDLSLAAVIRAINGL